MVLEHDTRNSVEFFAFSTRDPGKIRTKIRPVFPASKSGHPDRHVKTSRLTRQDFFTNKTGLIIALAGTEFAGHKNAA